MRSQLFSRNNLAVQLLVLLYVFFTPAAIFADIPVRIESQDQVVAKLAASGYELVLDVRSPGEFSAGHLRGAININYTELPYRLGEIAAFKKTEILLYCRTGRRARVAAKTLNEAGFMRVTVLDGHYKAWVQKNLPVER